MPSRFFDVVVLGTRIGALAAAALLARRDFRVLVLGHGDRPATYRYDGLPLRRRAFSNLAATSPALRRVLAELAQSQTLMRKMRPLDPMLQLLAPRRGRARAMRLSLPPDGDRFGSEIARSLPGQRQNLEELYGALARLTAHFDTIVEQDAVWPPGTFWERRETNRLRAALPDLDAREVRASLFAPPRDEQFDARVADLQVLRGESLDAAVRPLLNLPARFASHLWLDEPLPPLLLSRLHAAWTRGPFELPGDEDELRALLIERIRASGGDVRPDERCGAIFVADRRVTSVMLESEGEVTGCNFVLAARTSAQVCDLARDWVSEGDARPPPRVLGRRFVVTLVVRKALVPPPLARHAFLLPKRAVADGGVEVHLSRATFAPHVAVADPSLAPDALRRARSDATTVRATWEEDPALSAVDAETWIAEALLPEPGEAPPGATSLPWPGGRPDLRARNAVLETLAEHFPFLDEHMLVVDSPHDGGPLVDFRDGIPRELDRSALRAGGGSIDAELAEPLYAPSTEAYAGLCDEAIRAPLDRALLVGPSVVPALGAEGELMAAWGAARIVTKSDKKREKMRRELWSKIEI